MRQWWKYQAMLIHSYYAGIRDRIALLMMRFVFVIVRWKYVVGIPGLSLREKLHRDSRYEPRVAGHDRKELLTSDDTKCFFFLIVEYLWIRFGISCFAFSILCNYQLFISGNFLVWWNSKFEVQQIERQITIIELDSKIYKSTER